MYLTRVEIQNIRSISHLVWEIEAENAAGWHVILGDNGAGKSTFVRGAVLTCVGFEEAEKLEHYVSNWLNHSDPLPPFTLSEFITSTVSAKYISHMLRLGSLMRSVFGEVDCNAVLDAKYDNVGARRILEGVSALVLERPFGRPTILHVGASTLIPKNENESKVQVAHLGFVASFGPFRRFSGGDIEDNDLFESNPVLRRHRTTFSERLALPDALKWLQQTQFKALENDANAKQLIKDITEFVNQPMYSP